jgi:hypothetical protein
MTVASNVFQYNILYDEQHCCVWLDVKNIAVMSKTKQYMINNNLINAVGNYVLLGTDIDDRE